MAIRTSTLTWDNLTSAQLDDFDTTLYDQIYNKNIILKHMRENADMYDGGVNIHIPVEYDKMPSGSFDKGFETITPTDTEFISDAFVKRVNYYSQIAITQSEQQDNSGKNQILDLMARKYDALRRSMEFYLNNGLFSDGSALSSGTADFTTRLSGLNYWVPNLPTSGTVAGINRATYSWWRSQYVNEATSGVAGLTMYKIQGLHGKCTDGVDTPDLGVTTQLIFDKLWSLADTKMRLGTAETADLGYSALNFNGTPIVVDKNCPADKLYFLNTKYLKLKIHKDGDMKVGPWLQGPTQPFAFSKVLTFTGNLICTNPRYQGVLHTA
ncbi:MAG: phage major capsid protein [Aestuariibacter sp.]|nr:phage major capsid protein [Aestuariibacter sp.]